MDAAAHYRQLLQLGREEFLAAAAPAALVRFKTGAEDPGATNSARSLDDEIEETLPHSRFALDDIDLQIFPLAKKPGASFADRITIGRTSNNDVVIPDASVSRLHAYVRRDGSNWVVADGGSKNGSWLLGQALEARREKPLPSRAILKLGDVELTFYNASDLYTALRGQP